ncbi:DUF7718 family protein [Pseudocalidococcus azoricus]
MDGLDKDYIDETLSHQDRLRVRLRTHPSDRPSYAIMLECQFGDDSRWVQVIRADDWDDGPHLDICSPDGSIQKQWLVDTGNNAQNCLNSLRWMKENWEAQRLRYEVELNTR